MDAPADARHGQVRHGETNRQPLLQNIPVLQGHQRLKEGCWSNLCWPQVLLSSGHVRMLAQLLRSLLLAGCQGSSRPHVGCRPRCCCAYQCSNAVYLCCIEARQSSNESQQKQSMNYLLVSPTLTWLLCLQVIKYTAPKMSHLFETALGAWEVAAAAVLERQR